MKEVEKVVSFTLKQYFSRTGQFLGQQVLTDEIYNYHDSAFKEIKPRKKFYSKIDLNRTTSSSAITKVVKFVSVDVRQVFDYATKKLILQELLDDGHFWYEDAFGTKIHPRKSYYSDISKDLDA